MGGIWSTRSTWHIPIQFQILFVHRGSGLGLIDFLKRYDIRLSPADAFGKGVELGLVVFFLKAVGV